MCVCIFALVIPHANRIFPAPYYIVIKDAIFGKIDSEHKMSFIFSANFSANFLF